MLRGNKYRETIPSPEDVSCNCCNLSPFAKKSVREIFGEKVDNEVEHKDYQVKWRKKELEWMVFLCIFQFVYGIYCFIIYPRLI